MSLDTFTSAYIECALWSTGGTDSEGTDHESLELFDLAPEAQATMEADCKSFYDAHCETWDEGWTDEQAGHDFWLTRERHGAGFWDRYYGDSDEAKVGKELTDAAHTYGPGNLYIGDDNLIYC